MPRNRVEAVLKLLAKAYPDQPGLHVDSVPLKSLFHIAHTTGLDLKGRPMIRALQESGARRRVIVGALLVDMENAGRPAADQVPTFNGYFD